MALPSAIKLFINPRSGQAFGNFAGTSQITNPTFTLGDSALIELYLVEETSFSAYPRQELAWPGSPGIRVALGPIDESPLAGTWTIAFGGNTTSALAFNASAAVVQTALNLLASITAAGGVTVSKIGDNYNIVFNNNGARSELTTNGASLIPLSTATIAALQIGDSNRPSITLIHLQRTVAGLATSFTPTAASVITVESLSAWDGTRASYRASISPDPKGGSFSLAFDALAGDDVSTAALPIGSSALDVQNFLSFGALADGKVSVSQVGAYAYDITVTVQPGTLGLTANGSGIKSFGGYVGELSLNTAEAISLLDGANEVATNLEVEITSDSKTLTILQIPCILQNAVIDAASVVPLVLDSYLSQTVADGRYTRQANNLSDLNNVGQARTNLGVYATSSVDSALALKASLAGATFSGEIVAPTVGNILNTDLVIDSYNDTGAGTHYYHKFTPFDGKFVLAPNGGGLAFPDGTTQTTAFTGSAATAWGTISGSLSSQTDLVNALADKYDASNPSGFLTATDAASTYYPSGNPGAFTTLAEVQGAGFLTATDADLLYLPLSAYVVSFDANGRIEFPTGVNPSGFNAGRFWFQSGKFRFTDGTSLLTVLSEEVAALVYPTSSSVSANYAAKSGATFTGKVNFASGLGLQNPTINLGAQVDPNATNAIAGDVWISNATAPKLSYKVGTSNLYCATSNLTNTFSSAQIIDTTATTAALRVTQKGTGASLLVEDSTTPDTSALVVDAAGNVGIGVAVGYTAAEKVEVVGNIKADGFKNGSGPTFAVLSTVAHTGGSDTHELLVSIGGSTYRVGLRFVSTP